jgi:hypothetical protein
MCGHIPQELHSMVLPVSQGRLQWGHTLSESSDSESSVLGDCRSSLIGPQSRATGDGISNCLDDGRSSVIGKFSNKFLHCFELFTYHVRIIPSSEKSI